MKKALITGIFGQDGSYLAELLFSKGYEVHGVIKSQSSEISKKIQTHLMSKGLSPILHECDLNSFNDVLELIGLVLPDEIFHLAATHYSSSSTPEERNKMSRVLIRDNILSASNIINGICETSTSTRLVLANTCMIYDDSKTSPQDETINFSTRSVYGYSRIMATELLNLYRKIHNLHLSTAILYNHESPRRTEAYVSQKIAKNVVRIRSGEINKFSLGSLDSMTDWGYAKDYAYGMWLMAQKNTPDDYILATGNGRTIGEFVETAFSIIGIKDWKKHVDINTNFVSRTNVQLIGNYGKAERKLSWRHTVNFRDLVEIMVKAALENSLD